MDNFIDYERQDMADALDVCVANCASDPRFVAEFNRLTGCDFPNDGESGTKMFVDFVGQHVLLPLVDQYLEGADSHDH